MEPITGLILLGLGLSFFGGKKKGSKQATLLPDIDGNGEPDYQPGPVVIPAEESETGQAYLAKLNALISANPAAERFYSVVHGGPSASAMAGAVLAQYGMNTGSNRVRLIKCMTQIPWNRIRYASNRSAQSWGTLYDVSGQNLSAAWMPRNAPALQMLAMGQSPPRNLTASGASINPGLAYYGLLWVPKIVVIAGQLVCDPLTEGPPAWLMQKIGGE